MNKMNTNQSMSNPLLLLKEISYNLYWTWNTEFYNIFEDLNKEFWEWTGHNPVKFINEINWNYLLSVIEKKNLTGRIFELFKDYREYLDRETYYEKSFGKAKSPAVAYFSAEYGLTECLKIYSGGLGTLSGDHLKSASDLGIPLVAVGLAYTFGYFNQQINKNGKQSETFELNDFRHLPLTLVRDENYNPVTVTVRIENREVFLHVWEVNIGRVKLYLLDSALDENELADRNITDILYGGDEDKRIRQEIVLGIGGFRLLKKLGIHPKAFHINEGHSAFLCFERIRDKMKEKNIPYEEAKQQCYNSNIFTTHTPVPAGIDIFTKPLFEKYFRYYAEMEFGIDFEKLFGEGDLDKGKDNNDRFNMAYLAINNSNFINAVSKLHGEVSRKMWMLPESRSQIDHITNGVHTLTYLSSVSYKLYEGYFGKNWFYDTNIWNRINEISDADIWGMRSLNRINLIKFTRDRQKQKMLSGINMKVHPGLILNENALTIGFARRFATYKRGTLIFRHIERLKKILNDENRPVQIIFSGKAHPKDSEGKNFISMIMRYSEDESLNNKIIFLENYDLNIARNLVEGCDLWLNNPRRPLEASGTSGMKVIANGGLNFSILDGWWAEGFAPQNGWMIKSIGDSNVSPEERDEIEASNLFEVLENDIIPAFYERSESGIPLEWTSKIKSSILNLAGFFNTGRMVKEYNEKFYTKVF
jgi:starch phosphorylase